MLIPASPADFTIPNTKLDEPAACQFFMLSIDSLTMSLRIKQDILLTISAWDKLLFPQFPRDLVTFTEEFRFFVRYDCYHTTIIP